MITRLSLNRCSREYLDDNKTIESILTAKERVSLSIRKRRVDIYLAMEIQPYSRAAYQGQLGESVREEN